MLMSATSYSDLFLFPLLKMFDVHQVMSGSAASHLCLPLGSQAAPAPPIPGTKLLQGQTGRAGSAGSRGEASLLPYLKQ